MLDFRKIILDRSFAVITKEAVTDPRKWLQNAYAVPSFRG
jgi:hypothetical protein